MITALSVSLGVIKSVSSNNWTGMSLIAGAGFKIVTAPCFLAILKAVIVASSGVSNWAITASISPIKSLAAVTT